MDDRVTIIMLIISTLSGAYAVWNGRRTKVDIVEKYRKLVDDLTNQLEKQIFRVLERDKVIDELKKQLDERDDIILHLKDWAERLMKEAKENGVILTAKYDRRYGKRGRRRENHDDK